MVTIVVTGAVSKDEIGTSGDAKRFKSTTASLAKDHEGQLKDFVVENGNITLTVDKKEAADAILADLEGIPGIEAKRVSTYLANFELAKRKADAKAAKANKG